IKERMQNNLFRSKQVLVFIVSGAMWEVGVLIFLTCLVAHGRSGILDRGEFKFKIPFEMVQFSIDGQKLQQYLDRENESYSKMRRSKGNFRRQRDGKRRKLHTGEPTGLYIEDVKIHSKLI
uniref:Uncharacterized protein n=2 Tax=Parascaris univalens TaxID=6257 RepID=A0A915B6U2_PARUN